LQVPTTALFFAERQSAVPSSSTGIMGTCDSIAWNKWTKQSYTRPFQIYDHKLDYMCVNLLEMEWGNFEYQGESAWFEELESALGVTRALGEEEDRVTIGKMSFAMGKHLEYAVFLPSSNGDVVIQRHSPANQGNVEIAAAIWINILN
jgi:hypothetical protein